MQDSKKIIKAITRVVVETMSQYGTSVIDTKNDKDVTKKAVRKEVKLLIDDDELDYSEIVDAVTRKMLEGIKHY